MITASELTRSAVRLGAQSFTGLARRSATKRFTRLYKLRLIGFALFSLFACLYVTLAPCVHSDFYTLLLFHPWKYPKGDYRIRELDGIQAQDVWLAAVDGSRLHAVYFKNPGSRHTILVHHATGMNLTLFLHFAKVFTLEGDSVLLYDYRGFGRSSGSPSWQGICQDGQTAYNYLVQKEQLPPSAIINFGVSLGTGPASYVSAANPCGGLILISPYCSLRQAGKENLAYLNLYPDVALPGPDISTISVIGRVKAPVLIIHGMKDPLLNVAHARRLYAQISSAKRLVLVKNMYHGDSMDDAFMQTTVSELQSFARNPVEQTSMRGRLEEI
jgi:uncharacterized protein